MYVQSVTNAKAFKAIRRVARAMSKTMPDKPQYKMVKSGEVAHGVLVTDGKPEIRRLWPGDTLMEGEKKVKMPTYMRVLDTSKRWKYKDLLKRIRRGEMRLSTVLSLAEHEFAIGKA